jgi:hypothetical protein
MIGGAENSTGNQRLSGNLFVESLLAALFNRSGALHPQRCHDMLFGARWPIGTIAPDESGDMMVTLHDLTPSIPTSICSIICALPAESLPLSRSPPTPFDVNQ